MYWRKPLDQNRIKVPYGIIHIIEERCKGCGFCVDACPYKAIELIEVDSFGNIMKVAKVNEAL